MLLTAQTISNIGLSFKEIIQLTYAASWFAGLFMVYTGFTWYTLDELLDFFMFFRDFGMIL